ncbi:rab-GTPase-TBC domain-containing protein [Auriculariales sp. MPI-PUGE-AT-0066]|nr:rab-GTPase-TBC domain-containing protein [Auriculariales sp. MPI-PUGE-AT-0066]
MPHTDDIRAAVAANDWPALRRLSLVNGGFGRIRDAVWPFLLHSHDAAASAPSKQPQPGEPHPDERQIQLDTDRSFVLYPVGDDRKDGLKQDLNALIVSLMRRRRKLHYFQGYHDIISVLFLTLPYSVALAAAEKMSLHRLRDAMGTGLEPLVGQLQVLKRLLRLADPEIAAMVETATPLPYYALSNLLTLFSHDVPTLHLIQHVFDYLLCRPPSAIIYLAAVVILAHSDSIRKLVDEDEAGMLHAVLTAFPPVNDAPVNDEEPRFTSPGPSATQSLWQADDDSLTSDSASLAESYAPTETSATSLASEETASFDGSSRISRSPSVDTLVDDVLPVTHKESAPAVTASRSLSDLLRQADELYLSFPPSNPRLAMRQIFGPQSVLFTWNEQSGSASCASQSEDDPTSSPLTDDEAEALVDTPQHIIRPDFVDEDEQEELQPKKYLDTPSRLAFTEWEWWTTSRNEYTPTPLTIAATTVMVASIGFAAYDISRINAASR